MKPFDHKARVSGCGKMRWDTRSGAKRRAKIVQRTLGHLYVYACTQCGGFHLSRMSPAIHARVTEPARGVGA